LFFFLFSHQKGKGEQIYKKKPHGKGFVHGHVCASLERLHEGLGAGLGDGAEIVDEISLGHADAAVDDVQALVLLVGDKMDVEIGVGFEGGLVRKADVADLVKRIRSVRNELTKENLLVAVESVDDQVQQLIDLSLERERLYVFGRHDDGLWRGGGRRELCREDERRERRHKSTRTAGTAKYNQPDLNRNFFENRTFAAALHEIWYGFRVN
jgi:hypothetical protein